MWGRSTGQAILRARQRDKSWRQTPHLDSSSEAFRAAIHSQSAEKIRADEHVKCADPLGSVSLTAISFARRSGVCRRLANTSATLAHFERPTIRPPAGR